MKPLDIIKKYYPESSDAYRILVTHSRSVADKALALARLHPEMNLDLTFIEEATRLSLREAYGDGAFACHDRGTEPACSTSGYASRVIGRTIDLFR